jgi:serine/threonine-protein kinase
VRKHVQSDQFLEIDFSYEEMQAYRGFADSVQQHVTRIESGAKYQDDASRLLAELERAYRGFMLEETVPNSATVLSCLMRGPYYRRQAGMIVWAVRSFLRMFKPLAPEKKGIVMSNLHTRLDAIPRYDKQPAEADLPF